LITPAGNPAVDADQVGGDRRDRQVLWLTGLPLSVRFALVTTANGNPQENKLKSPAFVLPLFSSTLRWQKIA
jgi:hypothetical protein